MSKFEAQRQFASIFDTFEPTKTVSGNEKKEMNVTFKKDVFQKLLPEGMTVETYNQAYGTSKSIMEGMVLYAGEDAIKELKTNPEIKAVNYQLDDTAGNRYEVTVDRERMVRPPNGEPFLKHGALNASLDVRQLRKSKELSAMKEHIAELGAKELAAK